jgi:Uma2 family endonuclease
MKKFFILILFFTTKLFAQTNSVVVHKDPRVDSLVSKQIQINEETTRDSRRNIPGYRILVITSNDRNKVYNAKAQVYQQYPELQQYIIYQPPNYKLKLGNFKTQDEAQIYSDKLIKSYPTGVYIIHDVIEVKPE